MIILTRGYRHAQDERARRKNNSKYTEGTCQENMADIRNHTFSNTQPTAWIFCINMSKNTALSAEKAVQR